MNWTFVLKLFKAHLYLCLITIIGIVNVVGCAPSALHETVSDLVQIQERRSEARQLNANAIATNDLVKQQELLERSVQLDDLYGEAHQNLGVVYFRTGQLYKSAAQLQRAANLLPGSPKPYANLAVLHGSLQQWDRALGFARLAYERDPHSLCALRIIARALRESRSDDNELRPILERLGRVDPSPQWQKWANNQLFQAIDRRTQMQ